jgi:hypothetical protein
MDTLQSPLGSTDIFKCSAAVNMKIDDGQIL